MFETANILRRQQLAGTLQGTEATLAHQDLSALPIQLCPYLPLSERVWQLRYTMTSYDASYVAVAELLGVRLLTLDGRLSRASGPRCDIVTPSSS